MKHKKAITSELKERYNKATKKQKGAILDEFSAITGYNRKYAARALRLCPGKVVGYRTVDGKKIKYVIGGKKPKRKREKIYGYDVYLALKRIWVVFDFICSKRLAPFMAEAIEKLEKHKEINISPDTKEKLLRISASTIDRLLKSLRDSYRLKKGRKGTKPGTLLKKAIPIKTFSDWNDTVPGFVEVDLVGHDGGNVSGDYAQSLNFSDVATCWDIAVACKNKAQVHVFSAIRAASVRFPFKILGIDSDNGSEFINDQMLRYCKANSITFTRSRAYRKNDSCFVEQKNYSIVRRAVGYLRYDTEEELKVLNELYLYLGYYTNFFQPVVKLVEKTRNGSRVSKKYDVATTPYRRVLMSKDIDDNVKENLKKEYDVLNPADLKRKISRLQDKLLKLNSLKKTVERNGVSR
ncbi:MAG: integrase catalytic domain-containing protein [Actinomycetota bacterium]